MACKYYRYRLNPIIFNKLKLLKGGVILPFNRNSKAEYKHKLQILIKRLSLDLKRIGQYVQVLELCDGFSSEFPVGLFNLFPNIVVFKVYSYSYRYKIVNLVDLLSKLKYLKGVELSTGYYNYPKEQDDKVLEFFKSLYSLKFILSSYSIPLGSPFLKIDQSFSRLNTLTILNARALENLQFYMPNLKRIELPSYKVNEVLLANFFKLNPQLKRMDCKWHEIQFISRIWSQYTAVTCRLSEFKPHNYYSLLLTILNQYNIKYILTEYVSYGDPYINIAKVTWTRRDDIEVVRIYHSKFNKIDWEYCKRLSDVLVMRFSYFKFFEFDYRFNCSYSILDLKFVIN
jgi:hypothetical protein